MEKPKIKNLKYPVWFNIIFLSLTVGLPIGTLLWLGLKSPNPTFRVTFTVISIMLVAWIFIRKFALKHFEDEIKQKKMLLEHDYEIEAGDPEKCKWLWFTNEIKLSVINLIQIVLVGGLIILTMVGIQEGAIKVKGVTSLIAMLYLIAYIFRFIYLLTTRKINEKGEVDNEP